MESFKIMFVGNHGQGKSTTANVLAKQPVFDTGDGIERVTTEIVFKKIGERLVIIDSPGFGDPADEKIFFENILKSRDILLGLGQLNAFILVNKWTNENPGGFKNSVEEFFKAFGKVAVRSVIVLGVQEGKILAKDKFEKIIQDSDGYKLLLKANDNKIIPFLIWYENPFQDYDQEGILFENIGKVKPYQSSYFEFAFDLADIQLKNINERDLPKVEPKKPGGCPFL